MESTWTGRSTRQPARRPALPVLAATGNLEPSKRSSLYQQAKSSSTAYDPPSNRSLLQPRCLPRMSPLPIRPDVAARAVWCQRIALKQPGCLVLRHAAQRIRHPQTHPQRQMPPAKPYALFRQFARPSVPTLIATFLSRPLSFVCVTLICLFADSLFNLADKVLHFAHILFGSAV